MSSESYRTVNLPKFIKGHPFFIICCILLPPLALFLLFAYRDFSKSKKYCIALLLIVWTLMLLPPYNLEETPVFAQESHQRLVSSSKLTDHQISDEPSSSDAAASDEIEDSVPTVWVTESGTKYHSKADCSGMNHAEKTSLNKAVEQGYTPCRRCCQ
ncbi:MAG: hypothetical protein J6L81_04595 [Clostridia bacterium]|nr:hypothetical protein [Clostridia bacterium]